MAKILVTDTFCQEGLEALAAHPGLEVVVNETITPGELQVVIGEYDALLIRSRTQVPQALLAGAANLKLIVRGGEPISNIDTQGAAARGIVVENTPGRISHSVAELTLCHMFALARHLPRANAGTKSGRWEKSTLVGRELQDKTLGIIGGGKVGKDIGLVALSLGMNVLVYDLSPTGIGFPLAGRDELLTTSDFVSLHVPLTPATRGMIGAAELAKMKPTAYLINCAAGGLVDEAALAEAVTGGRIAGAGVDVYATEPPAPDNPLLRCEGIICTPHLGYSTVEAQLSCTQSAVEQLIAFFDRGEIINRVN